MGIIDGWIPVDEDKPPLLEGKDYSANVWGCDEEGKVLMVSYYAGLLDDYLWGDDDEDYDIRYWQPIIIPQPPK